MENLQGLERALGHQFSNIKLLAAAVTHSSFANEQRRGTEYNERLEFLGDSVLSIVVSEDLFTSRRHLPEGELTRIRAALVCETSCYEFAKKIGLGQYLRLGRGEENSGGRTRPSILADAFEAVLAALYLDGGLEAARAFILPLVRDEQAVPEDYKTRLQEIIQQNPEERLRYVVVDESGPDHNKSFVVEVHLNSRRLEFLGDSVLSIVVSEDLFTSRRHLPEGELTRIRAALVCETSCYEFAKKIGLGQYLRLGRGEENSGGRTRPSILADAFEAVLAALYLDGGLEAARAFILPLVRDEQAVPEDYKTRLQEIIQQNPEERLRYVVVDESGPDHNKSFVVEVHLNSNVIGRGEGHSKKLAEQHAAREALKLFGEGGGRL